MKAADMILDAMRSQGINTDNREEIKTELEKLFGRSTQSRLMIILTTQRNQVLKDAEVAKNSKGTIDTYEQIKDSPLMKMQEYEAALTNFRTEVGLPMLQTLTQSSQVAMPFLKFFANNPEIAKWTATMIIAGKALSAFTQTA